jgi:hypothetical protein
MCSIRRDLFFEINNSKAMLISLYMRAIANVVTIYYDSAELDRVRILMIKARVRQYIIIITGRVCYDVVFSFFFFFLRCPRPRSLHIIYSHAFMKYPIDLNTYYSNTSCTRGRI